MGGRGGRRARGGTGQRRRPRAPSSRGPTSSAAKGLPPREQRADRVTPEHLRRAGLQAAYTTSWSADRTFSAAKIAADSEGGQRLHLKGSSPSGSPSTCDLLDFSSRGSIGPPGDRAYARRCSAGRERPP